MRKGIVLFVDDDLNFTRAIKRSLRQEPFEVLTANSAAEGLEILEKKPVDVIVSDERMPGMSGSEFLAVVRRRYPRTTRILLTGYATLDAAVRAINDGEIYRFLTKPCHSQDLAQIIRNALARRDHDPEPSGEDMDIAVLMERLEQDYPGITRLKVDETGAIILDDADL